MNVEQLYQGVGMIVVWMGLAGMILIIGLIMIVAGAAITSGVLAGIRKWRAGRKPYTPFTHLAQEAAARKAGQAALDAPDAILDEIRKDGKEVGHRWREVDAALAARAAAGPDREDWSYAAVDAALAKRAAAGPDAEEPKP